MKMNQHSRSRRVALSSRNRIPVLAVATVVFTGCTSSTEWPIIDVINGCNLPVFVDVTGDYIPYDEIQDDQEIGGILEPGESLEYQRLTFKAGYAGIYVTGSSIADKAEVFHLELETLPAITDDHGREHRVVLIEGDMCPPPGGWS